MPRRLDQRVLPFKLGELDRDDQLTGRAGLPLIHELFIKLGVRKLIRKHVNVKASGYSEAELIEFLVVLAIAGGEHMDDIRMLRQDKAYQTLVGKEHLPCTKTVERFLKSFDGGETRPDDKHDASWVPAESVPLKGLMRVLQALTKRLIARCGITTATIENDATVIKCNKQEALGTFKGGIGYTPVIASIAELGLVLADEFRDGNTSPNFDVLNFFKAALEALPKSIKRIYARLDGAYYVRKLMEFFDRQRIGFTITALKSDGLMRCIKAIPDHQWKPLRDQDGIDTGRQFAEIHWAGDTESKTTIKNSLRRYLVTRKSHHQWELFQQLPFAKIADNDRYEVVVTNRTGKADDLIRCHYKRCGTIENTIKRIKNDLAGGVLPSGTFGANAAWWRIQCLALNIVRALQLLALPKHLARCALKKLRFCLLAIAGKVVKHANQIWLMLSADHPASPIYDQARKRIAALG